MRIYGQHWLKASVTQKLKQAARLDTFDGRMTPRATNYLEDCKAFHAPTGTVLIFTRDIGHHTSGWFKNPDYERCWHLSLSFREPFAIRKQAPFNQRLADEWAELFFGDQVRLIWAESAVTTEGKTLEVHHYRVFCDEHWVAMLPRGEVYSREFTEKGWQSWSDLHPGEPEPSILHAG